MGDAINSDVHDDLPQLTDRVVLPRGDVQEDVYDWPDNESVRPDIAQFYFYESPSPGITAGQVAPRPSPDEPTDLSTYKFPFVRSFSSEYLPSSPMMPAVPSDIHSYYFEEPSRDGGGKDGEGRSQFSDDDDEHNRVVRSTRFVARVTDAFHGAEKTRVAPKLRPI